MEDRTCPSCRNDVIVATYRRWNCDGSKMYKIKCGASCGYPSSALETTEERAITDFYAGTNVSQYTPQP